MMGALSTGTARLRQGRFATVVAMVAALALLVPLLRPVDEARAVSSLPTGANVFPSSCAGDYYQTRFASNEALCVNGRVAPSPEVPISGDSTIHVVGDGGSVAQRRITLLGTFLDEPLWLDLAEGEYHLVVDNFNNGEFNASEGDYVYPETLVVTGEVLDGYHFDAAAVKAQAQTDADRVRAQGTGVKAGLYSTAIASVFSFSMSFHLARTAATAGAAFGHRFAGWVGVAGLGAFGARAAGVESAHFYPDYNAGVMAIGARIIFGLYDAKEESYQQLADDPADPNYQRIDAPDLRAVEAHAAEVLADDPVLADAPDDALSLPQQPGSDDPLVVDQAELANLTADQAALVRAFMLSHERFLGARDADDLPWVVAHGETLIDHAEALVDGYERSQEVLDDLADGYEAIGAPDDPTTADEWADLQEGLADGFDAEQRRNLRESGYSEAERQGLLDEILATDPDEVGDGETVISMYRERRDALDASAAAMAAAADDVRDVLDALADDLDDPQVPEVEVTVPNGAEPGEQVTVSAAASGGDGELEVAWDLNGDGSFDDASGDTAQVAFDRAGPNPVTVRVTDERGVPAIDRADVEVVATPPTMLTGTPDETPVNVAPGDEVPFTVDAPSGSDVTWVVDGEDRGSGVAFDLDVPSRPGAVVVEAYAHEGDRLVGAIRWLVQIQDDLDGADALEVDVDDAEVEAGADLGEVTARLVDADGQTVPRADEPVTLTLERTDGAALPPGAGFDGPVEGTTDAQGQVTVDGATVSSLTPSGTYRVRAIHGDDRVASASSSDLTVTPPTTAPAGADVTLEGLGGRVAPDASLEGVLRIDLDDPDGALGEEVTVELDLRDPSQGSLGDPDTSVADEVLAELTADPDLLGTQAPEAVDGVDIEVAASTAEDAPEVDAAWVALLRDAEGRLVGSQTAGLRVSEPLPDDPGASADLVGLPDRFERGGSITFALDVALDEPDEAEGDVVIDLVGPDALDDGDADASFAATVLDPDDVIGQPLDPHTLADGVTVDVTVDVDPAAVAGGYLWGVTVADERGVLAADQAAGQVPAPAGERPEASAELAHAAPIEQGDDTTVELSASLTDPDEVVVDDLDVSLDLRDATGDDVLDPDTSVLDDVVDELATDPDVLSEPVSAGTLRDGLDAQATAQVADDASIGDFLWVLEIRDTDGELVAVAATPQQVDAAASPSVTFVTSGLEEELSPGDDGSFEVEIAGDDPEQRLPEEVDLSWDVRSDVDDPDSSLVPDLFDSYELSPAGFFDEPISADRVVDDGRRVRFDVEVAFDAPTSDLDGFPLVLEAHGPDGQLLARSTADSLLVGDDVRLPGTGGPVILTSIDPELGPSDCYHGCLATWQNVLAGVLERTRNAGSGVLVIGANSGQGLNWWTRVVEGYDPQDLPGLGVELDVIDDPDDIAEVDLEQYAMVGVATSTFQLSSGGITDAQNEALNARASDIATFINRGGGLLGHTQDRLSNPYDYISGVGEIVQSTSANNTLEITEAGHDAGIRQDFEGCCWHTSFGSWPGFMEPLVYGSPGNQDYVQVLGGRQVGIATGIELEPVRAQATAGETVELHASVQEDEQPVVGTEVTFTFATGGPHEGTELTADTGADGVATVAITGEAIGQDAVEATYIDSNDDERVSNRANLRWQPLPSSEVTFEPEEVSRGVGDSHTVTATVVEDGEPAEGREVAFEVDGVHGDEVEPASIVTDTDGIATFTYTGTELGDDAIEVTATDGMGQVWQDELDVTWEVREHCTDLIAAQQEVAGEVCASLDGDEVEITYLTDGGWRLLETHVAAGATLDDYHDQGWVSGSGNPVPGGFPAQGEHDEDGEVVHTIATGEIPGFDDASELLVGAHAVVIDGEGRTETAWGDGTRFREQDGPWGTYLSFEMPQV